MTSNLGKTMVSSRYGVSQNTRPLGRPGHVRSKSQAPPRPRTAHGNREDDRYETSPSHGTESISVRNGDFSFESQPYHKVRTGQSGSISLKNRDSSLTTRFGQMSLEDDRNSLNGSQATSRPPSGKNFDSSTASQSPHTNFKRRSRDKSNQKHAAYTPKTTSEKA